jgi:phosphopantothenoylcysteine decarboxylase/phosphopantothenate--cysteine ligase
VAAIGLGVTGGIGAYKAVEVARLLQKGGHDVRVVMTRSARRFVGPLTFEAITRHPVVTSQFTPGLNASIEHIDLASSISLLVVSPATANIIGKFANGLADDFLSSLYLATRAPVLMAPAMNTNMWAHPAVRENLARLATRGVRFVEPGDGYLACGWIGKGRLAEPEAIVQEADRMLTPSPTLAGRRVVVSAGSTVEDIDPVRFLGNRSSGRMGFALAAEARARGAVVTLVAGPASAEPPAVDELIRVRSARQMRDAITARAIGADVVVMAAAVADYTPRETSARKIDKSARGDTPWTLELEPTPDILAELGRNRTGPRPLLVGFAAQTGDPVPAARRKLDAKSVDLIVANDVTAPGAGFEVETNQVTLVGHGEPEALPVMTKREVARAVFDRIERLLVAGPAAPVGR